MVSMLPMRLHNNIFINGFPGSGNVIVHRLCGAILKAAVAPAGMEITLDTSRGANYGGAAQLIDFLGSRYDAYNALLQESLPMRWAENTYFQHRHIGEMDFVALGGSRFVLMTGIGLDLHLNTQIHSSHEFPSAESYHIYDAMGYSVIPLVRHPLDILVSYAWKSAASETSSALAPFLDTLKTEELKSAARRAYRFAICRRCIQDKRWVQVLLSALYAYYAPVAAMVKGFSPVRYRDILNNPEKTVSDLASRIGVRVTEENVKEISQMIGNVELAPNHLNSPSYDKWKLFFSKDQYAQVQSSGIFDLFSAFGYKAPGKKEFADTARRGIPEEHRLLPPELLNPAELSYMNSYLGLCNIFEPVELARQFSISDIYSTKHGVFTIVSNDRELLQFFSSDLTDGLLNRLGRDETLPISGVSRRVHRLLQGAQISISSGLPKQAEENYRETLDLMPNHLEALEGLARVLMARGENQEALGCLNAAICQAPDKPEIKLAYTQVKKILGGTH